MAEPPARTVRSRCRQPVVDEKLFKVHIFLARANFVRREGEGRGINYSFGNKFSPWEKKEKKLRSEGKGKLTPLSQDFW